MSLPMRLAESFGRGLWLRNPMQTPPKIVEGSETLYRRVKYGWHKGQEHYVRENGKLRVTSVAFQHPSLEISVNRAAYCTNGAHDLIEDPTDGVVSIVASHVRGFQRDEGGVRFTGEVTSSPIDGNDAHADMHVDPHVNGSVVKPERKAFNKFCEHLKRIAGSNWAIQPPDPPEER